ISLHFGFAPLRWSSIQNTWLMPHHQDVHKGIVEATPTRDVATFWVCPTPLVFDPRYLAHAPPPGRPQGYSRGDTHKGCRYILGLPHSVGLRSTIPGSCPTTRTSTRV